MKSRQPDVTNFWAFLLFQLPTGLRQRCWLNGIVYSSGNSRDGEEKTLPRALCSKARCPATITSTIGWAQVAALLGQLNLFVGEH
ncbi:hypothetical protein BD311DRAFT_748533 [Dichomitus squalens]|uniref:Uncharacterized protein n=1 Tax=Dichomitus squalens TaxID=114155 RepID=A0A4Q9N0S7_9APHY|nr:hypothetical protein BD311DRAFT_748533 [Dichomitus squalens]